MNGLIFDIQRFSLHDGPGIRTTVFFKGCPLRCIWCHNPESMDRAPQLSYKKGIPSIIGKEMYTEEIMAEIIKDKAYYDHSGGGLTLSGGEPTLQTPFILDLLKHVKEAGIHVCIETCGYSPQENFSNLLPLIDLFLFDYKATGEVLHQSLTGVGQKVILSNLEFLNNQGAKITLRCPMVPGINDQEEHLKEIAKLSQQYFNIKGVEILPYHDYARGKWQEIGKENLLQDLLSADDQQIKDWKKKLLEYGCLHLL